MNLSDATHVIQDCTSMLKTENEMYERKSNFSCEGDYRLIENNHKATIAEMVHRLKTRGRIVIGWGEELTLDDALDTETKEFRESCLQLLNDEPERLKSLIRRQVESLCERHAEQFESWIERNRIEED